MLKAESRFTQAADVLAEVGEPAARALGHGDPDVISLRIELADVLFLGGDHRRGWTTTGQGNCATRSAC
ncbi:MAG: protein kinase [Nonomuraea muscovyensis]|nr:protein kinase [Nonomuraea muscovyensis]